jgi:probable HAF family extracellular repeat protein
MTWDIRKVIATGFVLIAASVAAQTRTGYTVVNLGTTGGSVSAAISINNPHRIAGFSFLAGDQTTNAILWLNGTPKNLGTLGGPNSGMGWPNHNQTAVVGISETANIDPLGETWSCAAFMPTTGQTCLGFVWQNGVMGPLPTLGGNNGYAAGANSAGQVVGWAETTYHDPTCVSPQVLQFLGVIWGPSPGQIQVLPPLSGDPDSAATAINDAGQVVGISGICEVAVGDLSAKHAVLWQNGQPTEIPNLGGNAWNTPTAINKSGEVAGFSETTEGAIHAFVWTQSSGIAQDLGTLPGDSLSLAYAMNEFGLIVGQSIDANGNSRAVLWQNGKIVDLNSVSGSRLFLIYANDIDDSGRIVGLAYDPSTGEFPAFVAVPSGTSTSVPQTASTTAPALPQSVRDMLQRRHGFAPIR